MTNYDSRFGELEHDMEHDSIFGDLIEARRQITKLTDRLDNLEAKVDGIHDPTSATTTAEGQALETLAKAVSAGHRRQTPEGLLERGLRVLDDPTQVGVLESYVNAGMLVKAAEMLERHEAQASKTENDQALEEMEGQAGKYEQLAAVSELSARVAELEHANNSLMSRLSALETRRQVNPSGTQTVAKAQSQQVRRKTPINDPRETAEGLMTRAEGVIDSPAVIGQLSSMAHAGELNRLREIVEAAELRHETAIKKRDRRTL